MNKRNVILKLPAEYQHCLELYISLVSLVQLTLMDALLNKTNKILTTHIFVKFNTFLVIDRCSITDRTIYE